MERKIFLRKSPKKEYSRSRIYIILRGYHQNALGVKAEVYVSCDPIVDGHYFIKKRQVLPVHGPVPVRALQLEEIVGIAHKEEIPGKLYDCALKVAKRLAIIYGERFEDSTKNTKKVYKPNRYSKRR